MSSGEIVFGCWVLILAVGCAWIALNVWRVGR